VLGPPRHPLGPHLADHPRLAELGQQLAAVAGRAEGGWWAGAERHEVERSVAVQKSTTSILTSSDFEVIVFS